MKITWRDQEAIPACGTCSIRMVLEYFGTKRSEKYINKISGLTDDGLSNKQMCDTVRKLGLYAFVKVNSKISDLKKLTDAGIPVIVDYNHFPRRFKETGIGGHYAIVTHVGRDEIRLCDPVEGPNHRYTLRVFELNWFDKEEFGKQWLLAVSDKPIKTTLRGKRFNPV